MESVGKQTANGFSDVHVPFNDHFLICCFLGVLIFLWISFYCILLFVQENSDQHCQKEVYILDNMVSALKHSTS